MFKLRRMVSPDKAEIKVEGTLNAISMMDQVTVHMEAKMLRQIGDELCKMWIEEYGAKLIDKINPEDVEKHIKTKLAERILDK